MLPLVARINGERGDSRCRESNEARATAGTGLNPKTSSGGRVLYRDSAFAASAILFTYSGGSARSGTSCFASICPLL